MATRTQNVQLKPAEVTTTSLSAISGHTLSRYVIVKNR